MEFDSCEECYICAEMTSKEFKVALPCGHVFHDACLFLEFVQQLRYNNVNLNCPYCRTSLQKQLRQDFASIFEVKNFTRPSRIYSKYVPLEYEAGICCVLVGDSDRQCRNKIRKNKQPSACESETNSSSSMIGIGSSDDANSLKMRYGGAFANLVDWQSFSDFDKIKYYMCSHHLKNLHKVKYILHPKFNLSIEFI